MKHITNIKSCWSISSFYSSIQSMNCKSRSWWIGSLIKLRIIIITSLIIYSLYYCPIFCTTKYFTQITWNYSHIVIYSIEVHLCIRIIGHIRYVCYIIFCHIYKSTSNATRTICILRNIISVFIFSKWTRSVNSNRYI